MWRSVAYCPVCNRGWGKLHQISKVKGGQNRKRSKLALSDNVNIKAPLITWSKAELINWKKFHLLGN